MTLRITNLIEREAHDDDLPTATLEADDRFVTLRFNGPEGEVKFTNTDLEALSWAVGHALSAYRNRRPARVAEAA